ncbi:hypothetical protein GBA52_020534 [Prunus armeniaca]|nr:hypothetical protein GBA52_020534 [Prunus armeniaca]
MDIRSMSQITMTPEPKPRGLSPPYPNNYKRRQPPKNLFQNPQPPIWFNLTYPKRSSSWRYLRTHMSAKYLNC